MTLLKFGFIVSISLLGFRARATDLDAWVSQNAIHLDSLDYSVDQPKLEAFDKAISGKRIVFLGEAAHWVHEKYDYRLILLKRLIAKGFTNVGMEMGLSDAQRVDNFLASGKSTDLDRVALYGYQSPYVRSREIAGACSDNSKAYPRLGVLFKGEESWFFTKLRELGQAALPSTERVHYFGFDLDMAVGGGYEDIDKIIGVRSLRPNSAQFLVLVHPPAHDQTSAEIARLQSALKLIDDHRSLLIKELGAVDLKAIQLATRALLGSVQFLNTFYSRPCDPSKLVKWNQDLMSAMAARERMMFEIMREKLAELGPDAKIVLMGHDFHLSKDPGSLRFTGAEVPDPYAPAMWPSIGQYVSQTLKLPTFSVWMQQSKGFQSNIDCPLAECAINTGPDFVGPLLKNAGPVSLLLLSHPLDQRLNPLNKRLSFAVNGGTHSGNLTENADAIFYVETVSGLKLRTP